MPRQDIRRQRNTTDRSADRIESPGISASMHQRLYAPRGERRELMKFLGNLTEYSGRRALSEKQQEVDEFNDDLLQKAKVHAAEGEVDEGLMQYDLYRSTVNAGRGELDGKLLFERVKATAEQAAEEAYANGESFDIESYIDAQMGEAGRSEDLDYREGFAPQLQAAKQAAGILAERTRARLELEEVNDQARGHIFVGLQNGQSLEQLNETIKPLVGIRNERAEIIADAAMSLLAQAPTASNIENVEKVVAGWPPSFKAEFGDEVARSLHTAKTRLEAANSAVDEETAIRQAQYRAGLMAQSRKGQLDLGEATQLFRDGGLSDAQYTSLIDSNNRALEKVADDNAANAVYADVENDVTGLKYHALKPSEQKDFRKAHDQRYRNVVDDMQQIAAQLMSADGDQRVALQQQMLQHASAMRPYFDTAERLGFAPDMLKGWFSSGTNPASASFPAKAAVWTSLRDTFGPQVLAAANDKAVAMFDAYDTWVNTHQMDPQEAQQILKENADRPLSQATAAAVKDIGKSNFEFVWKDELGDGVNNSGYVKDRLEELVGYHYRLTGDAEAALESARERFSATHVKVDGYWMPGAGIPQDFPEMWDTAKPKYQRALRAAGLLGEDEDFYLVPTAATDSAYRMLPVRSDGSSIFDPETGEPLWLTPATVAKQAEGVKEWEARVAEATAHWDAKAKLDARRERAKQREANPVRNIYTGETQRSPVDILNSPVVRGLRKAGDALSSFNEPAADQ